MKKYLLYLSMVGLFVAYACGGGSQDSTEEKREEDLPQSILDGKGIGPAQSVELTDPLDEGMIAEGRRFFETQCRDCHRLDAGEIIGPGFAGITNRRKPEWIVNMMTNTKIMLELDPTARELLKLADRRAMPHQHLSISDARAMLEFLRNNDLEQTGTKDEGNEG